MFKKYLKAISPVVATALLLVVAVVAVVGFQTWFGTYSSGVFSDIDIQSNSAIEGELKIESLFGDTLYIINNVQDNLSVTELKIGGNLCTIPDNLTLGMNEVPMSSCIDNLTTSTPDIVLITEKNVVSKKVYVYTTIISSQSSSSSLDCSSLGLNGGDWVTVQGNSELGTSDFCVMKYEAKNVGGVPTSQAASLPWVSITQTSARSECESLGTGYHLITNAEWTTVAREAENNPNNWAGGSVGSGSMLRGNSDSSAAMDGTNPLSGINKRTLELESGELIWDLAGNVWDWNNDTCSQGDPWYTLGWIEWTNSNVNGAEKDLAGPNGAFSSTNGVGQYYGCTTNGNGFLRGGSWYFAAGAGAFALCLDFGPSFSSSSIGFRCSYEP